MSFIEKLFGVFYFALLVPFVITVISSFITGDEPNIYHGMACWAVVRLALKDIGEDE